MDWTITDLGPSDAERLLPQQQDIQALHALHRPEVFRGDADAAELLAFLRDRLEAEGIAFLGAERADGRLLGHAMLEIQEVTRDALKRARRRGVMHQIVVAPEARRMGVGLALVEAVKARLRAEDVPRLAASYWSFNDASAALMRRAGLEPAHCTMEGDI